MTALVSNAYRVALSPASDRAMALDALARPSKAPSVSPADMLPGAARRRTRDASVRLVRSMRSSGASVAAYEAAGRLGEAREAGAALGLVHSSTSDTRLPAGTRISLEIDPLQSRAKRLRKNVITGARLHDQEAKEGSFRGAWYFLTLTYRDGRDCGPRDISELLKRLRGKFNRIKDSRHRWYREVFRYVWVGELMQSGVPHYHVMLWIPRGMFFQKPDEAGWWPHGWSNIEKARNCVGYLAKYASKFTSITAGLFPKGFRTSGVGGLNQESKRELRWWKASKEVQDKFGHAADIRKVTGGWLDKHTGEFWPSPWRVTFLFGRVIAWKITA